MPQMIGSDPDALDRAASQLRSAAYELDQDTSALSAILGSVEWLGAVAGRFLGTWGSTHRLRMTSTSQFIREAADKLESNARAQRQASGEGGLSGAVPGPSLLRPGPWLGETLRPRGGLPWSGVPWNPGPGPRGGPLPHVGDLLGAAKRGSEWLGIGLDGEFRLRHGVENPFGKHLDMFGYIIDGYTVGEELFSGEYVDAGLTSLGVTGDVAADFLKRRGTAVGYLAGVNVQIWSDVAQAARHIDWSPDGIQAVQEASLGDWGKAVVEVLPEAGTKIYNAVKFW